MISINKIWEEDIFVKNFLHDFKNIIYKQILEYSNKIIQVLQLLNNENNFSDWKNEFSDFEILTINISNTISTSWYSKEKIQSNIDKIDLSENNKNNLFYFILYELMYAYINSKDISIPFLVTIKRKNIESFLSDFDVSKEVFDSVKNLFFQLLNSNYSSWFENKFLYKDKLKILNELEYTKE